MSKYNFFLKSILLQYLFTNLVNCNDENSINSIMPIKESISLNEESFFENFADYSNNNELFEKWIISKRNESFSSPNLKYPIIWSLLEPYILSDHSLNDKGLAVINSGAPAMIGHILEKPIKMNDNDKLIIQYEVKLQKDFNCGGAFIKLLGDVNKDDLINYNGYNVPIQLVFGPDKCNQDINGVILEIFKKNTDLNKIEGHKLIEKPLSKLGIDFKTHLYTLIIDSRENTFEIRIDGIVKKYEKFNKENIFKPNFINATYKSDEFAKKPEYWVNEEYIIDINDNKPEDWDEDELYEIPDPNDIKPEDWDENIKEYIIDENDYKPDWWNDEEDGKWKPRLKVNPECLKGKGCGKWKPKMIKNPKYKGDWKPRMIKNPNYIGEWERPMIIDENIYYDKMPSKLDDNINGIVFDFISGSQDMIINNIYIGKSINEAEIIGNTTYMIKREKEEEQFKYEIQKNIQIVEPRMPIKEKNNNNTSENIFDHIFDYLIDEVVMNEKKMGIIGVILIGMISYFVLSKSSIEEDEYEEDYEIIYTEGYVNEKGEIISLVDE